jgi:autotransporter passenger strand-loop-strand repeat protein
VLSYATLSAGAVVSGAGVLETDVFDFGLVESATVGIASSTAAGPIDGYLYVFQGGVASNVTVRTGLVYAESGGTAYGDVISSGGFEYVASSGTVSGSHVLQGGIEVILPGAIDEGSTISSGGIVELGATVTAGQTLTVSGSVSASTTVSGATLLSGAVLGAYSDVVSSGATLSAGAGAIIDYLTVSSGGAVTGSATFVDAIYIYGSASGGTVGQAGGPVGFVNVLAGSGSGLTIDRGFVEIYSGATASSDIVSSGGSQFVQSGGTDVGGTVLSGGLEILDAGGVAQSVTVSSGGMLEYATTVSSGVTIFASGTAFATSTYSGVTLLSGASLGAYEDVVLSSGVLSLGAGAVGVSLYIESGGKLVGAGTVVGTDDVYGLISGVGVGGVVGSSGAVYVEEDATASGLSVRASGAVYVYSGLANGDVISAGGRQIVYNLGIAFDTTLSSGGVEIVSSGLYTESDTISAGGVVSVLSGGEIYNDSVLSGGRLYLASGAFVNNAVAFPSATLELQSMTVSSGITSTISQTYGNGTISGVTLAGASLIVDQTTVSSGGVLSLGAGVVISNVTVSTGGVLLGPGEIVGATLVDNTIVSGIALGDSHGGSGTLQVVSGAFAIAVAEAGAGDLIAVSGGGSAIGTVETGVGARLSIAAGGYASATTIRAGADAQIYGSAAATHISSGGVEFVESGAAAAGTVVLAGGLESILAGGTTSVATVSSGGTVSVAAGGKLRQATEIAGGVMIVNGVATWAGTTTYTLKGSLSGSGNLYEDGPGTLVLSDAGAAFGGEALISGGTIELASASGLGTAKVDFENNTTKKTLKIDAADRPASGGTFANTLIDFDSSSATYVDLAGLAFVTGAKATLSGATLTLTDGTYSAKFTLSGTGASKYTVFSDGAGGTEIRAAIGSTQTPLLVHAMAAFDAVHGAAPGTSAHSAGATSHAAEMLTPR